MKCLVIIPARAGSKGIPGKNTQLVAGKPLIEWTIEAAKNIQYAADIVVSSDDPAVLAIAHKHKIQGLLRPAHLATDTAPTEAVIAHLLEFLGPAQEDYDFILLLQPTSPLRRSFHINQAIAKIIEQKADALISVTPPEKHPLKAFLIDDNGAMRGLINNEYPFMARQELPTTAIPNGAIYIVKTPLFLQNKKLFQNNTMAFFMSHEDSIDIDTPEDIQLASARILGRIENESN